MNDAIVADRRRAEEARAKLVRDIQQLKKMGNQMIDKTETAIHKAPVLLGLGAVGLALVGVAVFASRRPAPRRFPGFVAPERRSFWAEAARGVALSALGIVGGRVTQHLLTAVMKDATRAT
jgi:hypothetical protein